MRKKLLIFSLFFFIFSLLIGATYIPQTEAADLQSRFYTAWVSDETRPLKLVNPTGAATHVLILFYERDRIEDDGSGNTYFVDSVAGDYSHCHYIKLPPHGAANIEEDLTDAMSGNYREYAEIISYPQKIVVGTTEDGGSNAWPCNELDFSVPQAARNDVKLEAWTSGDWTFMMFLRGHGVY